MAAILQTTFAYTYFRREKILVFWLNYHRGLCPMVQLTLRQHWFR